MTKDSNQEMMKIARTQDWYDSIWKTVGKCVFCDLRDKYILHEENGIVLTINLYPYIDGQMMAIPRRHVSSPKELSSREWETMRKFSYIAKKIIRKAHGHKGMWSLIREGGEVANMTVTDHLHMQLVPFDAPDLCKWNYRELQYTPLENVKIYKDLTDEVISNLQKFNTKYSNKQTLPIVCDAVIIREKSEVLLAKHKKDFEIYGSQLTTPGGHVDNIDNGLIKELIREVKEETNLDLEESKLKLVDSTISSIKFVKRFNNKKFLEKEKFIWNIYACEFIGDEDNLKAGDDIEELVWVKLNELDKTDEISDEVKFYVKKAAKMIE